MPLNRYRIRCIDAASEIQEQARLQRSSREKWRVAGGVRITSSVRIRTFLSRCSGGVGSTKVFSAHETATHRDVLEECTCILVAYFQWVNNTCSRCLHITSRFTSYTSTHVILHAVQHHIADGTGVCFFTPQVLH